MSYSMQEPDWPVACECVYDEARDEMDRDNCPLHYHLGDDPGPAQAALPERKPPAKAEPDETEAAA